jgi:cytochrome c-type biogenesis protein CcmH
MPRLRTLALAALLVLFVTVVRGADVPLNFSDAALQARYESLLAELRCLVCQNQSLADSHAELAQDLRNEVFRLLENDASDAEVLAFMVERYGDFVLYEPPLKASTVLLWAGPVVLALGGAFVLVRLAQRRGAARQATLSAEERARLDRLIAADRQRES